MYVYTQFIVLHKKVYIATYIHIYVTSFTVLNQENDELNKQVRQLSKQQHPSVMVAPVNPNGVQPVCITDIV